MTPSLRAKATIARLVPRRLTRSNAQALSRELLVEHSASVSTAGATLGPCGPASVVTRTTALRLGQLAPARPRDDAARDPRTAHGVAQTGCPAAVAGDAARRGR